MARGCRGGSRGVSSSSKNGWVVGQGTGDTHACRAWPTGAMRRKKGGIQPARRCGDGRHRAPSVEEKRREDIPAEREGRERKKQTRKGGRAVDGNMYRIPSAPAPAHSHTHHTSYPSLTLPYPPVQHTNTAPTPVPSHRPRLREGTGTPTWDGAGPWLQGETGSGV
jgi:hypothetical protein